MFPGPDALEKAMRLFIRNHDPDKKQVAQIGGDSFTFQGMGGHTVRRDGSNWTANSIVQEFALPDKEKRFNANNVLHYRESRVRTGKSCFDLIMKNRERQG